MLSCLDVLVYCWRCNKCKNIAENRFYIPCHATKKMIVMFWKRHCQTAEFRFDFVGTNKFKISYQQFRKEVLFALVLPFYARALQLLFSTVTRYENVLLINTALHLNKTLRSNIGIGLQKYCVEPMIQVETN